MRLPARFPDVPVSVVHILAAAAEQAPGAVALVCAGERLTYNAYWRSVQAMARRLRAQGVMPGDRVAVVLPNGLPIAVGSMAVMAAGAVLVPLNPLYTVHELAYILEDAAPRLILADPSDGSVCAVADRMAVPAEIVAVEVEPDGAGDDILLPAPRSLGMIQYTGGTTGKPKGVMLSHTALAVNVTQREARLPTRLRDDCVLIVTPLYHSYATAMGLFLAANCAGTLVILPRYNADAVLATIPAEQVTLFAGSPTLYIDLLAHPGLAAADLASLRLCYSGSAALSREVLERWEARAQCPIVEGYGQTEAGPVLTYMPPDAQRRPGTVGSALDGTEIRIVDVADPAHALGPDTPGEVCARGPQIMQGYWNRPEETATALQDGWLHTGDIGTLSADGVLSIRDRKKDMVIVSGFNVYPREVEEELHAHPQVREAAVVGRPDPKKGEALVAFVVAADGAPPEADALRDFLAQRLTRYKLPSEIRLIDALPKSAIGKTDKAALRGIATG